MSEENAVKVKVAVRVRPSNRREIEKNCEVVVRMGADGVTTELAGGYDAEAAASRKFTFDHSFWSHDPKDPHFATQSHVYSCLGVEVLKNAFAGYNACIFAYGQTGSGKSYTMMGSSEDEGLIPRLCREMFVQIESLTSPIHSVKVEVSYLEIYNENVRDLLNPNNKNKLRVREHKTLGPYVESLSVLPVNSYAGIEQLMEDGGRARTVAATAMNAESSRSHAVFTILLTQSTLDEASGQTLEKVARISLVDLAGSERVSKTGVQGDRLKEAGNINKSLTTLGLVIANLADQSSGKKGGFVPYRDSVLTWLLKDNLGGNARTVMVATVSPASDNIEESLSTLRYADRAKRIVNHASINEDPNAKIIRELREELNRLRELVGTSGGATAPKSDQEVNELRLQLEQNQTLMQSVSKTWEEKLREAHRINEERQQVLETMGISVSHHGVAVDSSVPCLVNMNEDPSLAGMLVYPLKVRTHVGRVDAPSHQDIQLKGLGIESEHAIITRVLEHRQQRPMSSVSDIDVDESLGDITEEGKLSIEPVGDARVCINGREIVSKERLYHGDRICFGNNHLFRVNFTADPTLRPVEQTDDVDLDALLINPESGEFDWQVAQSELARHSNVSSDVITSLKTHMDREKEVALEEQRRLFEEKLEHMQVTSAIAAQAAAAAASRSAALAAAAAAEKESNERIQSEKLRMEAALIEERKTAEALALELAAEKAKIASEKAAIEKLANDRLAAEQQAAERAKAAEALAEEKALAAAAALAVEKERIQQELEAEKAKIAMQRADFERMSAERAASEQEANERAKQAEMLALEQARKAMAELEAEKSRIAAELAAERAKIDAERTAALQAAADLAAQRAEVERIAAEKVALERIEFERMRVELETLAQAQAQVQVEGEAKAQALTTAAAAAATAPVHAGPTDVINCSSDVFGEEPVAPPRKSGRPQSKMPSRPKSIMPKRNEQAIADIEHELRVVSEKLAFSTLLSTSLSISPANKVNALLEVKQYEQRLNELEKELAGQSFASADTIQQQLMDAVMLVREANAMAKALLEPVTFEVALDIPGDLLSCGGVPQASEKRSEIIVQVHDNQYHTQHAWPLERFKNRIHLMRDMYNKHQDELVDAYEHQVGEEIRNDYFRDPPDYVLIGVASFVMKPLEQEGFVIELTAPIVDSQGNVNGDLTVRFEREPQAYVSHGNFGGANQEIGMPYRCSITPMVGKRLPRELCSHVYCTYSFFNHPEVLLPSDQDASSNVHSQSTVLFGQKNVFEGTANLDFCKFLEDKNLGIKIFGYSVAKQRQLDQDLTAYGPVKQKLEKYKKGLYDWVDTIDKYLMYVNVLEPNEEGEWGPVETEQKEEANDTGPVFLLRQNIRRRIEITLKPIHHSGVVSYSGVESVQACDVKIRSKFQPGAPPYGKTISRRRFNLLDSAHIQHRRPIIQTELDRLAEAKVKTAEEKVKETLLLEEWVALNQCVDTNTNEDIPAGLVDPSISVQLESTVERTIVNDEPLANVVGSVLPLISSENVDNSIRAVLSWDPEAHDDKSLMRQTGNGDRCYAVLRVCVKIIGRNIPIVLLKRICVRVVGTSKRRISSTFRNFLSGSPAKLRKHYTSGALYYIIGKPLHQPNENTQAKDEKLTDRFWRTLTATERFLAIERAKQMDAVYRNRGSR